MVKHIPRDLQSIVEAARPRDVDFAFKPMFGGILAYADGKPFLSLSDVGLALKLSGALHDELLALPGAKPLQYPADMPPSKTYVVVPETMLSDAGKLRDWLGRGAVALKASPKKAPKRTARPPN